MTENKVPPDVTKMPSLSSLGSSIPGMSSSPIIPEITPDVKKKLEKIKNDLEKFKKDILKKTEKDEIVSIALLPPPKEKANEKEIHVLVIVKDPNDEKTRYQVKDKKVLLINKVAEDVNKDIKPQVMLTAELREACYDAKYDLLQLIATSASVYDPSDLLAALRISEIHKSMTLKKFEKYIVSYVAAGSLFRGEKSHDIDVYIIVDDTDVKRMSRAELKDKLGAIIRSMGAEASMITGIKKQFHIQTYILTDFWDSVKDANPVIYTFLRDGVPLYDRGVFMPWKLLLEMGRIKPSQEAIDMQMDIGDKLIQRVRHKLLSVVGEDLYYALLNPAQAAIMLYGLPPPTPKESVKILNEIFVKKEKLLEKKYVDILEKVRKYYKDIEHGKMKDVSGTEIDSLLKEAEDYLKRIQKLFNQILKKSESNTIVEVRNTCYAVVKDVLKSEGIENVAESKLVKTFETEIIKKNKLPAKVMATLKNVDQALEDYKKNKLTRQELEKIRREASLFIKILVEHVQRKRGFELDRAKIRVKYSDKFGEVLLLDDVAFIIPDIDTQDKKVQKAEITKTGGLKKVSDSSVEEMEKHVSETKIPHRVFIKEKIFEDLRKLFGNDVEVLVSY